MTTPATWQKPVVMPDVKDSTLSGQSVQTWRLSASRISNTLPTEISCGIHFFKRLSKPLAHGTAGRIM
jgi:hypothetical protein